jgi:NADH dehydrogenase FAD-containing subunit
MKHLVIMDSGLADPMGDINTETYTLKAKDYENMYAVGDATNVPTSKAGAVAQYEADIIVENLVREIEGQRPEKIKRFHFGNRLLITDYCIFRYHTYYPH